MKKGIKLALALVAAGILVTGCNGGGNGTSNTPDSSERVVYHLVSFYVDTTLYKTARVEEGKTVGTTAIPDPTKDGYTFVGWTTSDSKTFDLANDKVTADLSLYAKFEQNVTPTPDPDPTPTTDLNVDDTKDATKSYYLVVGWYAKTETTGLTDEITRHFYSNLNVYLKAKGATDEQLKLVSFRKFSQDKVADMGAAINEQGDIDILIGVGKNITSGGGVETKEKEGGISMGGKDRYIARLTDGELVEKVYTFMKTATGKKMYDTTYTLTEADITAEETPTPDPDPETPTTDLNVDDTKDATKSYYLVIGWYAKTATSGLDDTITKHFYSNINIFLTAKGATSENLSLISFRKLAVDGKVAALGTEVNAQGDIDIAIGVGSNFSATDGSNVVTKELDGPYTMGAKTNRYIARITDKEIAQTLYTFMKTDIGQKLYDTTYTLTVDDINAAKAPATTTE